MRLKQRSRSVMESSVSPSTVSNITDVTLVSLKDHHTPKHGIKNQSQ